MEGTHGTSGARPTRLGAQASVARIPFARWSSLTHRSPRRPEPLQAQLSLSLSRHQRRPQPVRPGCSLYGACFYFYVNTVLGRERHGHGPKAQRAGGAHQKLSLAWYDIYGVPTAKWSSFLTGTCTADFFLHPGLQPLLPCAPLIIEAACWHCAAQVLTWACAWLHGRLPACMGCALLEDSKRSCRPAV